MTENNNNPVINAAREAVAEKIIKENGLEGQKGKLWYDIQSRAYIWVPEDAEQPSIAQVVFDLRKAVRDKTGEAICNYKGRFFRKNLS